MLTERQNELLRFIFLRDSKDGIAPSFEEMKEAMGLRSKGTVHRLVAALERRGFVRRFPKLSRALEVIRLPEPGDALGGLGHARGRSGFRGRVDPAAAAQKELPLYGPMAASMPVEALREPEGTLSVPQGMIGDGRCYALTVAGDSMVDAGIMDGDTLIIHECGEAESGEIVVALVDSREAALGIWRPVDGHVVLETVNAAPPPEAYEPERVQVQGRLVALMRAYGRPG